MGRQYIVLITVLLLLLPVSGRASYLIKIESRAPDGTSPCSQGYIANDANDFYPLPDLTTSRAAYALFQGNDPSGGTLGYMLKMNPEPQAWYGKVLSLGSYSGSFDLRFYSSSTSWKLADGTWYLYKGLGVVQNGQVGGAVQLVDSAALSLGELDWAHSTFGASFQNGDFWTLSKLPPGGSLLPVSIGAAKSAPYGCSVSVENAVVTAPGIENGVTYAEAANRSSAIKLVTGQSFNRGDKLKLTGIFDRIHGEYQITGISVDENVTGGVAPNPVCVSTRTIGSDRSELLHFSGLNISGMLVRLAGKVTSVVTDRRVVYVDDGGGYQDGVGPSLGIRVHIPAGVTMPAEQSTVGVTGVVRVEEHSIDSVQSRVNGISYPLGTVIYVPTVWLRDSADLRYW